MMEMRLPLYNVDKRIDNMEIWVTLFSDPVKGVKCKSFPKWIVGITNQDSNSIVVC